ncbi:MAG: AI-2E family transporter [Burkholderiaceae bacterium]
MSEANETAPTTFPHEEPKVQATIVTPGEQQRVLLHMPVDVRSVALIVLTVLALLAVLRWASPVFIPFMIGLMISYALSPAVDWLERKARIHRAIGAAVLMISIMGVLGTTAWSLADDANELIESLPVAAQKLRDAVRARQGKEVSTLDTVQKAAAELERATEDAAASRRGVMRVEVQKPRFNVKDYLWTGTMGLLSLIGQATVVLFLTYFLLLSGNTFRRKLVKIAGPTLSAKKITVQALDEITGQVQRYLLVQLLASVLVGVTTGLAFWAMGLEHAAVWGVAAAVLNLIPYIGSIVVTAGAALVAFMQFGSVNMALYIGGISLVINTIEGNLLVPWLTSKASRMNPVAVFIGVLAWGWLWGVWGLLLGIPILMAVKAVCDRVDDLKPVGELLGA